MAQHKENKTIGAAVELLKTNGFDGLAVAVAVAEQRQTRSIRMAMEKNGDGKTDCWKNVTANPSASRGDPFGPRMLNGVPDNHTGIDISVPTGTSIRAGGNGTVLAADDQWPVNTNVAGGAPPYGNFIVINHADGTQAQYFHLESVNVTANQTVTAGQVIGTSNNTGRSSGAHMHYAVWKSHNHAGQSSKDLANFHDPEQHHGNCPTTP